MKIRIASYLIISGLALSVTGCNTVESTSGSATSKSTPPAWAHKPSDSLLSLTVQDDRIEGRWDIALRDLDDAIGLDADGDGAITWGEVRSTHDEIAAHALSRLTIASGETPCPAQAPHQLIDNHTDGAYAVLLFTMICPTAIETIQADYRLLFDLDAQHKGLLRLTHRQETTTAIFSQESPTHQFTLSEISMWGQARQYMHEGIWHIWLGYDHMLFLLALLLPAVLRRAGGPVGTDPGLLVSVL